MVNSNEIKLENVPNCFISQKEGEVLYKDIEDKLFGVAGNWTLYTCKESKLIWLNPRPVEEEIYKVYDTYYTHVSNDTRFSSLRNKAKFHLYNRTLGYNKQNTNGGGVYNLLSRIPIFNNILSYEILKIKRSWGKKILDVGCGNGKFLSVMKELGWEVFGLDTDEKAVEYAKKEFGVEAKCGTLKTAGLPPESFDVIVMSHVIEHVYDVYGLMADCFALLKKGGRLVIVTPNSESLLHKKFKRNWRGLEVPRHINIFSLDNLNHCATKVGFATETLTSTPRGARYLYAASMMIKNNKNRTVGMNVKRGVKLALQSYLFQIWEELAYLKDNKAGEEIYFVGLKEH